MTVNPKITEVVRFRFIDGLRGLSVIFMILNHTARWWMNGDMGWARYYFIYYTLSLGVPIWLFLVGFSLSISFSKTSLYHPANTPKKLFLYARRGFLIILAGYALTILIFPEDPWYGTTALHTIGLGMITSIPLLVLLKHKLGRILVLAVSPLFYLLFIYFYADVNLWVTAHPITSPSLFFDFAPWPWISAIYLGLVPGWLWINGPVAGWFNYLGAIKFSTAIGIVLILMFVILRWTEDKSIVVDFQSDLLLNNHWIPKTVTTLLMYGILCLLFSLFYWIMEIRQIRMEWLITLGKTTLTIYFIHHLIALVILKRWYGIHFDNWFYFAMADVCLIAMMVCFGQMILHAKTKSFNKPLA